MDQKTRNRLVLSLIGVPIILIITYIILNRAFAYVFLYFFERFKDINFHVFIYIKLGVMIGTAGWIILFAYVFVRYGEFKLDALFKDRQRKL
jgi:hypothetical protein